MLCTTEGWFFSFKHHNNPLNLCENDCFERLTVQVLHFSVADMLEPVALTLQSDLHTTPCARPDCLWSGEEARERDTAASVPCICKNKGHKCKTCNKWLTDGSTDMDANSNSLGTRRKETDNPVSIFWIRKNNQHPCGIHTGNANKLYPVLYSFFIAQLESREKPLKDRIH